MESLVKKGDIVRTKAGLYGIVVEAVQGVPHTNVTVSLADRYAWMKFGQHTLEKITDVSSLPDDVQEALN